jgi:hypothetical protein
MPKQAPVQPTTAKTTPSIPVVNATNNYATARSKAKTPQSLPYSRTLGLALTLFAIGFFAIFPMTRLNHSIIEISNLQKQFRATYAAKEHDKERLARKKEAVQQEVKREGIYLPLNSHLVQKEFVSPKRRQ